MAADITKSAQHIVEDMVLGRGSVVSAPLPVKGIYAGSVTFDAASATTGTSTAAAVTITGAAAGDIVIIGPPAAFNAGQPIYAVVTAADTVSFRVSNVSAATVDPASGTFTYLWIDLT